MSLAGLTTDLSDRRGTGLADTGPVALRHLHSRSFHNCHLRLIDRNTGQFFCDSAARVFKLEMSSVSTIHARFSLDRV